MAIDFNQAALKLHEEHKGNINSSTYKHVNSQTLNPKPSTHQLTKSQFHKLINLQTQQLKTLKSFILFYKTALVFTSF